MMSSQRRFAVMGENLFRIANRITKNQTVCRLLCYPSRDPFSKELPDVDGIELINKQILIVPKIYDGSIEKMSYLVVVFDDFFVNPNNPDFKTSSVRFDIACPYDEWQLDNSTLRPYALMQEVDQMFNQAKIAGIGNLAFHRADALTLSPQIGGYSMRYFIDEFN